MSSDLSGKMYD